MNVKNIEKKENNLVNITVEVSPAEFEAALNRVYLQNKKSIYVPGFRKGKAPRSVVEGMYGKDVFYQDAVEMVAQPAYEMAMSEESVEVVGRGTVTDMDVAEDKTVTLTFEFALYPEVKLGQYTGLEAAKPVREVTEADVEAELNGRRERNARIMTVDRPAENGDIAVIDYEGFKDGVPFEGGKAQMHELTLGSGSFIPGFEDGVVGMTAGEEKDIELTFPTEYHAADLAGAAVVFKVKLNEVKVKELPELDDEFAKDVSENFETLDELKADIKATLQKNYDAQAESEFRSSLMAKAVENLEVQIPDAMLEDKVDEMMNSFSNQIQQMGFTMEKYCEMTGMQLETLRGSAALQAGFDLKRDMLCRAIYESGAVEVTDEEVDAEYTNMAEQYDRKVEELKEGIPADLIKRDLGMLKASELIFSTGVVAAAEEAKDAE